MSTSTNPVHPIQPLFWRVPDVAAYLNISRSTIYVLQAGDESFPKAVQLGPRAVGWRRAEIERWAATRPPARVTLQHCP